MSGCRGRLAWSRNAELLQPLLSRVLQCGDGVAEGGVSPVGCRILRSKVGGSRPSLGPIPPCNNALRLIKALFRGAFLDLLKDFWHVPFEAASQEALTMVTDEGLLSPSPLYVCRNGV